MIKGIFDNGAMQSLERLNQFTNARHRVLVNNIANLNTPHFRPRDLEPGDFQKSLQRAVDRRRRSSVNPVGGELKLHDTRQLRFHEEGITPSPAHLDQNIMFHDRNNRDLERQMQYIAENTMTHNLSVELLRNQFDMLRLAIRERI